MVVVVVMMMMMMMTMTMMMMVVVVAVGVYCLLSLLVVFHRTKADFLHLHAISGVAFMVGYYET